MKAHRTNQVRLWLGIGLAVAALFPVALATWFWYETLSGMAAMLGSEAPEVAVIWTSIAVPMVALSAFCIFTAFERGSHD